MGGVRVGNGGHMLLFALPLTYLQFRAANSLRSFRNMSTNPLQGRLTYYDGPLVWIDCEMTGLDYKKDRILEIAVIILGPTCVLLVLTFFLAHRYS